MREDKSAVPVEIPADIYSQLRTVKVPVGPRLREVFVFTPDQLAKVMQRSPQQVQRWGEQGILPKPAIVGEDRSPVYTEHEVEAVLSTWHETQPGKLMTKRNQFTTRLAEKFAALVSGVRE